MNNTELTLDQLSEVAGGAPHYTNYGGTRFMKRAIIHPQFKKLNVWTNGSASSFRRFRGANNLVGQEQQP